MIAAAQHEAAEIRNEAESTRLHILEASRHQAIELTGAARADVERTLEWSRAQAETIVQRARAVAEQLLTASLRGEGTADTVRAIIAAAEGQVGAPAVSRPELPAPAHEILAATLAGPLNGGAA